MPHTFFNEDGDVIELPDDTYCVHVSDEMDARRLHYLVCMLGEEKIRRTALKYSKRYPGSSIYVTNLLKQYRVKVPTYVYTAINIPIYRVYLLYHRTSKRLKIGCSGNWLSRVYSFTKDMDLSDYDLDKSLAFSFQSDKKAALLVERALKDRFAMFRCNHPKSVPYSAGGHGEWFCLYIYDDVLKAALQIVDVSHQGLLSLRDALRHRDLFFDENMVSC